MSLTEEPTLQADSDEGFGARLYEARRAAHMSLADATIALHKLDIPAYVMVKQSMLRRYEQGYYPPEKADPVLIAALASIYGVKVTDISETVYEGLEQILALGVRSRCPSPPPPTPLRRKRQLRAVTAERRAA